MTEARYMGIDPGKSGGWAVLRADGTVWGVGKNADTDTFLRALDDADTRILLEKVGASPQMGRKSAFSFGESFGLLQGMLLGRDYELDFVTPQTWQKAFGLIQKGRKLGQGDTKKKRANKAKAQRLFPSQKVTHAWADALLIAEYCRRVYS